MRKVLTAIEKLDSDYSGLLFNVKNWFDRGQTSAEVCGLLQEHYGLSIKVEVVEYYRAHRWAPEKDRAEAEGQFLEACFKKFGGNYGLDLAAFARIRELLKTSNIREANSIRLAVLKIRAQDLKEEEFKLKVSQARPDRNPEELEAESQEHQRKVLRRIKEIFGLPTEDDPAPEPATAQDSPAAGCETA